MEFQAAILKQMPRPEEIDQTTADAWCQNQKDLKRVLAEALLPKITQSSFKVRVDYSKTLAEMVMLGNYDTVDESINDNYFPLQGEGQRAVKVALVNLDKTCSFWGVPKELKKRGLDLANLEHLLSFGATFPDVQRKFSIFALGTINILGSDCLVPYLTSDDGNRELRLIKRDLEGGFWHRDWRVLALCR